MRWLIAVTSVATVALGQSTPTPTRFVPQPLPCGTNPGAPRCTPTPTRPPVATGTPALPSPTPAGTAPVPTATPARTQTPSEYGFLVIGLEGVPEGVVKWGADGRLTWAATGRPVTFTLSGPSVPRTCGYIRQR